MRAPPLIFLPLLALGLLWPAAASAQTTSPFRFKVTKGGDRWERRSGAVDLRRVADADVPEAGPVVFPAYASTTVSVRSILATFSEEERAELIRELRAQAGLATDLNLTGQPGARSAGGGDSDVEPREGDTSPISTTGRARALLLRRPPITLPENRTSNA